VDFGSYSFYVYFEVGERHNLAHLHVRWPDDGCVLMLPTLEILAGAPIPRSVREHILDHLETIIENWNRCNPERAVEE
jgi:Domain of unknown function (DUF4160)